MEYKVADYGALPLHNLGSSEPCEVGSFASQHIVVSSVLKLKSLLIENDLSETKTLLQIETFL